MGLLWYKRWANSEHVFLIGKSIGSPIFKLKLNDKVEKILSRDIEISDQY